MTKHLSLVKNEITYEEAIIEYLENLSDEEREARVSSLIILGTGEKGPFYSAVRRFSTLELIGLLEEFKYYLIESSLSD